MAISSAIISSFNFLISLSFDVALANSMAAAANLLLLISIRFPWLVKIFEISSATANLDFKAFSNVACF